MRKNENISRSELPAGASPHTSPARTFQYDMIGKDMCASGRMIRANLFAPGTQTPQGDEASTKKNRAPVNFTSRNKADNGSRVVSVPAMGHRFGDVASLSVRGRMADDRASVSDIRLWEPVMLEITLFLT